MVVARMEYAMLMCAWFVCNVDFVGTDGEFILTNFCDLNIASHPPSEDEVSGLFS